MADRRASDVLIVGGGIIGCSVAYFLKQLAPETSVVVVERDPTYRRSSTLLSASAIRQQFNLAINVAMARFTYDFFASATEHLSLGGEPIDLDFTPCPYLVLAAPDGVARLTAAHANMLAAGARIALLTVDQLADQVPWLKADGIGAACLGLEGEGWFDPALGLMALRRKTEAMGVCYLDAAVVGLERRDGRIACATTAAGARLHADWFVNAAGAQAASVAAMAGVHAPIAARQRCAFVFRTATPPIGFTNLVDPTFRDRGVYARPYGRDFMSITSPDPAADADDENFDVDDSLFDEIIRPALGRRVQGFEQIELVRSWAGLYEMNTFDQNALVGPSVEYPNYLMACGLSGHGVMHAPAIGRGVAEHILSGHYQTLDLTPFSCDRLLHNRRLDDLQASEHRTVAAGI